MVIALSLGLVLALCALVASGAYSSLELQRLNSVVDTYRERLLCYDEAAIKFIMKVESGKARSRETYSDLKSALSLSQLAQSQENL